jgi:hypothetical protein
LPLSSALARAGIPPFKLKDAENQMKQVGRSRALKLSRWLVDADLAMKGHNSRQPASRLELERLLFRLSPQADSRRAVQPS